jgi:hypothetical protein
MKLTDVFTAPAIADNWMEVHSNVIPYLGSGLFPSKKKAGLDLSWIKGYKGLPVSLMPSSFDAKPTFRDRIGVTKFETEMAFFRESMLVKEKDEQEIMRVQDSNDPWAQTVLNNIFDDTNTLIDGAMVVPERMIMQLLSPVDGDIGINITANNVPYVYKYDTPDHKFQTNNFLALTGTNLWSNTGNSDPMTDIKTALDNVENTTGTRPTTAIMSRATFNYLLANTKIKSGILAQNVTANIFMTDGILKAFLQEQLGITIIIYTKKYKNEAGVASNFYPDNMCTFIPDGALGSTWYGTTPEERSGTGAGASISIVNTGVAVSVYTTPVAPINTVTTASEIVVPSFERMDECFVMKVG